MFSKIEGFFETSNSQCLESSWHISFCVKEVHAWLSSSAAIANVISQATQQWLQRSSNFLKEKMTMQNAMSLVERSSKEQEFHLQVWEITTSDGKR